MLRAFREVINMKRKILPLLILSLFAFGLISVAYANPSPNGPGQPGAPGTTCGSPNATNSPPGLLTDAFLNVASLRYAGSPDTPSLEHANSVHAISQYDIACYQVTQHGLFPVV